MNTTLAYSLIEQMYTNTVVFNISWIFSLVAVFLTLLALSRDTNDWKDLALPVTIGWHIVGLQPFILLYIVTAIMFVVNNMSLTLIGDLMTTVYRPVSEVQKKKKWETIREKNVLEKFKERDEWSKAKAKERKRDHNLQRASVKLWKEYKDYRKDEEGP